MSIEGQGHFFTIYLPGFVCYVLYLAKISGERLQDHWSSGSFSPKKFLSVFSASIGAWASKLCIHLEGGQVHCVRENQIAAVYFSFFFKFSIFPSLTPM